VALVRQKKMGRKDHEEARQNIDAVIERSLDTDLNRRDEGSVTAGPMPNSQRQNMADFVHPRTPEILDRMRLIRAHFTIHDPMMRESLVSIAEQLANGRSPMLVFGTFARSQQVRKSRLLL
jgi:hypothetical protein